MKKPAFNEHDERADDDGENMVESAIRDVGR
jgi:hypothetical protein